MKIRFTAAAITFTCLLSSTVVLAQTDSNKIAWCKHELAGGRYNETIFKDVLVCEADNSSSYYQDLCYVESIENLNGRSWKKYEILQYNDSKPGSWSTRAVEGNDESKVVVTEDSVKLIVDQSVLLGSNTISEVNIDLNLMNIEVSVYKKGFFGNKLLGSDSYSCKR